MVKFLRGSLIFVGVILPFVGIFKALNLFSTMLKFSDIPNGFQTLIQLFMNAVAGSFESFGIGLLCLFAAYQIKPFGQEND